MAMRGRRPVACGIDIGSTNTKVLALDEAGEVVARIHRPTPRNDSDLSVDAAGVVGLLEDMVIEACGDDFSVAAVAAAGVGEDGVLVDAAFRPLGRALAWFDPRRTSLLRELAPILPPAETLGVGTDPARTLVGWSWAIRQPGSENAAAWIALTDYPGAVWAGTPFMSDTLAARTAAWDWRTRVWHEGRVRATLRAQELLPAVTPTGQPVAPLRSPRLQSAGVLASGALVVAGGHDHPIGGWGIDQAYPGSILDSMGTAEVVVAQSRTLLPSNPPEVDLAPGIGQPGTTLLSVSELARNVDWASEDPTVAEAIRSILSGDRLPDGYVDSDMFSPGSQGGGTPHYASNAPARAVSRASAVLGALARQGAAALESVGFWALPDAPVFTAGGWTRSPGWIGIKQAATERPIRLVAEPEVTAAGAALLAAHALSWRLFAASILTHDSTHLPSLPH